jgi:hypothetical protein
VTGRGTLVAFRLPLDDAKAKDVMMGALASDGGNSIYPLLLNGFLGTRFKVVLGYQGGNTIQLAMERGEVEGRAVVAWSGLKSGWPAWIAERKINVIEDDKLGPAQSIRLHALVGCDGGDKALCNVARYCDRLSCREH